MSPSDATEATSLPVEDRNKQRRAFRPGIRGWLIAMIVVVVTVTEIASYLNASGVLNAAVRDREADKAAVIGRVVEGMLGTHTARLEAVAALLQSHPEVIDAILGRTPRNHPAFARTAGRLRDAVKLDVLEFTDRSETIVYRTQDPDRKGDRLPGWGVAEALAGQASVVTSTVDGPGGMELTVRAIAPLRNSGTIVGTVIAGMKVNDRFLADVAREAGAQLTLIGRNGRRVASSQTTHLEFDQEAIQLAFANKLPYAHAAPGPSTTVLYVPILLVDEAFVIQVVLDSASAYRVFSAGARHSAMVGSCIALVAVLLAVAMLRFALAPLRRLRLKTRRLAQETGGRVDDRDQRQGDEIASTASAIDAVTEHLVLKNSELARARDDALAASEAKSSFLSSMSHEIRTPLNGILGMADLLQRTPLTPAQRKYCDAIRGSGQQLHGLLSDVLDLAKIEAGRLTLEAVDFDFHGLAREIGTAYRELAAERGTAFVTEISPDVPSHLRGDPTRLRQVLSNLIGNAVKFTEGGRIVLSVVRLAQPQAEGRTVLDVRISDTGIGIAPDKISSIFNPFMQADTSTTRTHGGTGLGLAICERIVHMMGGTIRMESSLGKGTTLFVQLPFDVSDAPQASAEAAIAACALSGHVLVAEDNPVNQIVVSEMLGALGLRCTIANNGQQAAEAMEHTHFDLVLMDCLMPVLDGFAATARIRRMDDDRRHVPIVALTANAFAEDRQRCIDAGMDDYLSKPVTMKTLEATLRRWLEPAQSYTEQAEPLPAPATLAAGRRIADEVLRDLAAQVSPHAAARIVRTYLDAAAASSRTLKEAARSKDFEAFRTAVHGLKSSSRSVGALALGDCAQHAEQLARECNPAAFDCLPRILHQLDQACRELDAYPGVHDVAA